MAFPAFLDACVLVPITLTDLLLRLAEAGTYRPLWSADVLAEVERALPRVGVGPDTARWRVQQMRDAFPDALVTGYEALIAAMTNDAKDRHVLAAAVRADAAVIVTHNLKDFPDDAIRPHDITIVHPDDYLLDQLDLYPAQTLQCVHDQVAACQNPAISAEELLDRRRAVAPHSDRPTRRNRTHRAGHRAAAAPNPPPPHRLTAAHRYALERTNRRYSGQISTA